MTNPVTAQEKNPVPLLAAQAACAAVAVAMLYALGNTSFILENGAENLPYAYLMAFVLTPPLSFAYNRLQRRWPVSRLTFVTIAGFIALHLIAWAFARSARVDIAAYMMFVGFALALAFLVIVVTTQTNRLLTADQMKTHFPIILAVQTVALIACGLAIAPVSRWVGGELQTLLVGAGVMTLMMLVLLLTIRRYPQLAELPEDDDEQPLKTEELLKDRLPRLLMAYQCLSSTGSLMVLYIVPLMAEQALTSNESLTQFFGNLLAGATFGALLFLVFIAGRILVNRGVAFGLVMNPVGVIGMVIPMLIISVLFPERSTLLLGFAAASRALDFILSVGATETSVNTFIKQLPENTQLPLINAINAQAVPLSYGLSAVIILLLQLLTDSLPVLLVVTLAVCACWTALAFRLAPEAEKTDDANEASQVIT